MRCFSRRSYYYFFLTIFLCCLRRGVTESSTALFFTLSNETLLFNLISLKLIARVASREPAISKRVNCKRLPARPSRVGRERGGGGASKSRTDSVLCLAVACKGICPRACVCVCFLAAHREVRSVSSAEIGSSGALS